eukprot:Nk52_evm16s211 gene=Nk52_evmTU16s211
MDTQTNTIERGEKPRTRYVHQVTLLAYGGGAGTGDSRPPRVSYHSHSGQFCMHARGQLREMVETAVGQGFRHYGLTEHMPRLHEAHLYPEEAQAGVGVPGLVATFDAFVREARRLQVEYVDKIRLWVGMETDYIGGCVPWREWSGEEGKTTQGVEENRSGEEWEKAYVEYINSLVEKYQLDYVVGSLHHVCGLPIDFDEASCSFTKERLCGGDSRVLTRRYYDEQWRMLQSLRPQVVGHLDLVRLYGGGAYGKEEEEIWQRITRNVDFIGSYGGIIEINSSAIRKGLEGGPYPQVDILRYIASVGIMCTLSDDAHAPEQVGACYDQMWALLGNSVASPPLHLVQIDVFDSGGLLRAQ